MVCDGAGAGGAPRRDMVLRETEPGHCGIYLLTTASGNGFVGRYLRAPAPCGLRVGKLGSNVCSSADTPMSRLLVRGGWAPSWVSGLCGRSQGTAASTSSQPQAVMDSSADTSAPRLLAACGSGSWVPASDLSADISAARRLVAYGPGSALRRGAVLVWVCT